MLAINFFNVLLWSSFLLRLLYCTIALFTKNGFTVHVNIVFVYGFVRQMFYVLVSK